MGNSDRVGVSNSAWFRGPLAASAKQRARGEGLGPPPRHLGLNRPLELGVGRLPHRHLVAAVIRGLRRVNPMRQVETTEPMVAAREEHAEPRAGSRLPLEAARQQGAGEVPLAAIAAHGQRAPEAGPRILYMLSHLRRRIAPLVPCSTANAARFTSTISVKSLI